MKNYILLALLFLIGTSVFAQNIPTPEFTGRPYALENGKLAETEAGEYAFVPNGIDAMSAGNKMKITCFGID